MTDPPSYRDAQTAPFFNLASDDEDIELDQSLLQPSRGSPSSAKELDREHNSLKELGLKRLSSREHVLVALSRDVSIVLILKNLFVLWSKWYKMVIYQTYETNLTQVRGTEFFLAGLWCLVSSLLSYSILDGLMARWMVMYAVQAAIVRILSMSLLIVVLVELLNYMFNNSDNEYCLPAWIIISCVLTIIYIVQNYVTSNLRLNEILLRDQEQTESSTTATDIHDSATLHRRINSVTPAAATVSEETPEPEPIRRKVDLYNLTVYAVVPIGVASFITMVGLVRLLVILRLEIGVTISNMLANALANAHLQPDPAI